MEEQNEITNRIVEIMKHYNLNTSQFSEQIDVMGSTLSHILMGRNNPSVLVCQKILYRYPELNAEYLMVGRGHLLKS